MKSGLEGLEGVVSVTQEKFSKGTGIYLVEIGESKGVTYAALEEAVEGYTLDGAEITVVGAVEKDDKGHRLIARGSGAKYQLVNPEKKEGEKEAPDVTAQADGLVKEGVKAIQVKGALKAAEGGQQVIHLESAEAAKKKEE
ncbi:MAG: hypothetical protein HYY16_10360 [Planctomycetes bacterium]|nr:hypothetical protein [Planctomycetota bacterium]